MIKFLGAWLLLLSGLLVGCDRTDKSLQAEDETNPYIRQALAAQREFNFVDAAKAYETALAACPDVATAHFELGLLYADRLNDPIRAMYHFQCYIDQRPHAENREGAEKRLESIKIQFAATVPNSPIQNAEAFAKLQADNQNLLKELDDARVKIAGLEAKTKPEVADTAQTNGVSPAIAANPVKDTPDVKVDTASPAAPGTTTDTATPAVAPTPAATTPSPASGPVVQSTPPATTPSPTPDTTASTPAPAPTPAVTTVATPTPTVTTGPAPSATSATPASTATAATATSGDTRTYTILKGDTLWSIAKKYYPGQITAGIEKIKNANTDKLPEGKPLKIGVTIVIP